MPRVTHNGDRPAHTLPSPFDNYSPHFHAENLFAARDSPGAKSSPEETTMRDLAVGATDPAHRLVLLFAMLIVLAGCCGSPSFYPGPATTPVLKTRLMGGQQPISGASVQLYAVGDTGYGTGATPLLATPVTSDQYGDFSVPPGAYTCPANDPEMYWVASGGNSGGGTNPAITLMAPLGPCQNWTYPFVAIDEVTTIASVWALAPFMSYGAQVGTAPSNTEGLATAFTNIGYLADVATGYSPGTSAPQGITIPVAEINTMADILAACANSGGTGSASCSSLFNYTTPPGGTAPQNTLDAALNMVLNPNLNVSGLFDLPLPDAPFEPTLSSPPASWSMGNAIVENPVPAISSLSPSSLPAGSPPQTLTINGSGFLASSTVTFNGTGRAATYIGSSQLTIALTSADLATAGSYPVVVSNPVPGGGTSAAASFNVTSTTPVIVNVSPVSPAGYQGNGIAVQGSMAYISTAGTGSQNGARSLSIVSLATPAAPTIVSTTSSGLTSDMAGIAVSGSYAYVPYRSASGTNFQVWNVSNPQSPFVAGSTSISCPAGMFPFGPPAVYGNDIYVSCFEGEVTTTGAFFIVDVSNPAAPSVAGSVSVTSTYQPLSLAIWEQNLYVVATQGGVTSDYVLLYSIQDPAAPSLLATESIPHSPQSVAAQGTTALVPIYDLAELQVIDFSSPSSPQAYSVSLAPCRPMEVAMALGNLALVTCDSPGGVAEVSLSTSPATYVGAALSGTVFNFIAPSGSFVYAVDGSGNFETIAF